MERGGQQETTKFDPRPFALIFETLERHFDSMISIEKHIEAKSDDLPRPETPHDRALRQSITCGQAMYLSAGSVRNRFSADNSNTMPMESKIAWSERRRERVRDRMLKYPVEGCLDGSVTVAIPGFLSELLDDLGGDVDMIELSDRFVFIKNREGDHNPPQPRDTLHLPILLINYQRGNKDRLDNMTANAQRLACASAVGFLAALGIKDFPVYGLATYAHYGVVPQAWYSETDNCCYSMDGVTPRYRFNLCREEGVLRLMNLLHKLERHAWESRLRERFENVRPAVLERARTEDGRAELSWSFDSQLSEDDLWEEMESDDMYCDAESDDASDLGTDCSDY